MNRFGIGVAILVLVWPWGAALAAPDARTGEPILEVDPGGHQGIIRDLIVTADGRYLVSGADDHTIRVWDIAARREVRRILGEGGPGYGQIFAIALSPDDRWLAVGGFLAAGPGVPNGEIGAIRVYDFASGGLVRVLRSHSNSVFDLAFSPDGRRLVSGSGDRTVKVWDATQDFRLERTLEGHKDDVYAVRFLPDGRIISAGYDHQVLLWDGERIAARYRHEQKLDSLAVSRSFIAVSGKYGQQILILDHDLKRLRTLESPTKPIGLAVSRDGRRLAAGTAMHPLVCILYDTEHEFKEQARFTGHDSLVKAIAFLADGTLASGGGINEDIWFWDRKGREQGHLVGQGRSVWKVGLGDSGLRWGHRSTPDPHRNTNPLEQRLDLDTWTRGTITQGGTDDAGQPASPIAPDWSGDGHRWTLEHASGGDYGFEDAVLVIRRDGQETARIVRGATDGFRHRSYGFTSDGTIVSAGGNGALIAYDRDGHELARLLGHTGEIWSIATRGHWLLSGSMDQTLRLWNLDPLKTGAKRIEPVLSVFPAADGDWVAWTPKGYYRASANGDHYVGFHVNHGPDRAAEYLPAARFRDSLNRPDILRLAWETGSESQAITQAGATRRTEPVATAQLLPPRILLTEPAGGRVATADATVRVAFCVESQTSEPIAGIDILLNGRPLAARGLGRVGGAPVGTPAGSGGGGLRQCRDEQVTLAPDLASQTVTVLARNRFASANPAVIEVSRRLAAPPEPFKPDLYVLAIGVSRYARADLNLGLAAADAQALAAAFAGQKALFKRVQVRTLSDAQADKNAVLDALDWVQKQTTQRDLAVIFLAGHGVNDDQGNYYFLPQDADPEHLRRSGVRWGDLKEVVTGLPGKVLLLADTCHSGNIFGGKRREARADLTAAIQSITSTDTGQVIMTAATGSSASIEDPAWGHGAFTRALLDGLAGQADYNHDGSVTVKELDLYVTQRVKDLTGGRQQPTTIMPESIPDFAVSVH